MHTRAARGRNMSHLSPGTRREHLCQHSIVRGGGMNWAIEERAGDRYRDVHRDNL